MYDETKLEEAVNAWVAKRAKLGYGQHYTRELLKDFENFLAETTMLQASPGMPAFGRQLTRLGLGQRRLNNKTYRTGIALISSPPEVEPVNYAPAKRKRRTTKATQGKIAKGVRRRAVMSDDDREERKRKIKERMASESKESVQDVPEPKDE